jgi:hypothetical protein
MSTAPDQSAELKFVVTNTLIVGDIQRSVAFYRDVLGATVLREGEPTFLRLGNIWLTVNGGGDPTDDKPEVVAAPPRDPNVLSNFLNLRGVIWEIVLSPGPFVYSRILPPRWRLLCSRLSPRRE